MNLSEVVEQLTQQYMRENDWPARRARRKALSVVRRKAGAVKWNELPPPAVVARRMFWRELRGRILGVLPAAGIFLCGVAVGLMIGILLF